MQVFIDSNLKISGDIKHIIPKQEIFEAIHTKFPSKNWTNIQIIYALKDKGIEYNPHIIGGKTKGCFVGVLFQSG